MSNELFHQMIGIALGFFGSAAAACEHTMPGVVPRMNLIQYTGGYEEIAQYAKSKNLSALLLERETKSVVCWSYNAESKYFQTKPEERSKFAYFAQFESVVFSKDAKIRSMKIKDNSGTYEMSVIELFVLLLNAIKETALAQVEMNRKDMFGEAYRPLDPKEVLYVLTVPALWDDEVNIFYKKKEWKTMRECGQKCGMHNIEICFEPIAATFAVVSHSHSKDSDDTKRLQFFEELSYFLFFFFLWLQNK
ncbi:hypothetical protein RFI_37209 [Reticulomyxa filosa]|uniref:Uncharacterized protein n=1 Tax=Reticulomyxa filosa TaxID=46433 RepID=X6LE05_RETFI|nr:hypothetical protein RFI_37209 [Reticulomyxa filosa]|eukprot:ETO00238.1 hypothetical protein RFI_37209 [Reticulomyxa filosa]